MTNPDDELKADVSQHAAPSVLRPMQKKGADVGLPQDRALVYVADVETGERISLTFYEGDYLFEHFKDADVLFSATGPRSDDPMLLEQAEAYMRSLGLAMAYPTLDDHKWLEPAQFAKPNLPEDWKVFFDESSGADLKPDRFYGFGDAGGIAGSFDGYATADEAVAAIAPDYGTPARGREHLGDAAIAVMSGREYVAAVHDLGGDQGYLAYGVFK
jgi:hypothetical protein